MPVAESSPAPIEPELKQSEPEVESKEAPKVAPTIKELEADEPLLQENPHRFVLFPLKYHEIWQSKCKTQHATRAPC